jgi:hypothetical protein
MIFSGFHIYEGRWRSVGQTELGVYWPSTMAADVSVSSTGGIRLTTGSGRPIDGAGGQINSEWYPNGASRRVPLIIAEHGVKDWLVSGINMVNGVTHGWLSMDQSGWRQIDFGDILWHYVPDGNVSSGCALASVTARDNHGLLREKPGQTGCAVTFGTPWPKPVVCIVQGEGSVQPKTVKATSTKLTWTNAKLGDVQDFAYQCS